MVDHCEIEYENKSGNIFDRVIGQLHPTTIWSILYNIIQGPIGP